MTDLCNFDTCSEKENVIHQTSASTLVAFFSSSSSSCVDKEDSSSSLSDQPLDTETFEFLQSVKRESDCLHVTPLPTKTIKETIQHKKRCTYLDYILKLDAVSALGASSLATSVVNEDTDVNPTWEKSAFECFINFRQFLGALAEKFPHLQGEQEDNLFNLSRQWDYLMWEKILLEQDVTVAIMGACDSVKCIAVLQGVAELLFTYNKTLKNSSSKAENDLEHAQQLNLLPFHAIYRVLAWGFAALAGLDRLQAVEQNVSYTLQRIRRSCRSLLTQITEINLTTISTENSIKTHTKDKETSNVEAGIRLIQFLIENYFDQR